MDHKTSHQWEGEVYVDGVLPFGLCSAPKIFTAIADGLEWILRANGVGHIWHYLDDYITIGDPSSGECAFNCLLMTHTCDRLGIPVALEKCEGPSTHITLLGIELDTVELEARLPREKLHNLQKLVTKWHVEERPRMQRDLESLTGQLQHAATVVRAGRTFMRRM